VHADVGRRELAAGVVRVDLATRAVTVVAEAGDAVALAGARIYVLTRGNRSSPGTIRSVGDGEPHLEAERPGGFGRADLAVSGERVAWLADVRADGGEG